jgi:redox-sensitive bicupin YhaK (pirin superfamily)
MTAGRGIVHSERSPPSERPGGPKLYGMQTWLALPDGREEIEPAFEARTDLPEIEDTCARAQVIMGTLWGATASTTCHAETIYADIVLGPGGDLPIDSPADERAVMLVGGAAAIDGRPLGLYELTVLAPGGAPRLTSDTGGRIMLLGGEAFERPRHVWWNFVHSSRDRIAEARDDWKDGKFPKVPGDEQEFIPIPEVPKTVSYP